VPGEAHAADGGEEQIRMLGARAGEHATSATRSLSGRGHGDRSSIDVMVLPVDIGRHHAPA